MRGRLTWDPEAGRYFLWDRPVHAGDGVELLASNGGRWIRGRIETEISGRVAFFHHADPDLPWPGPLLLAVAIPWRDIDPGATTDRMHLLAGYAELRWPGGGS